ncbi:MAG: hypothetical protein KDC10_09000, partial [Calditrichaeota bacterium]|nr:hypothetical protein [Calditrichota bacterium]
MFDQITDWRRHGRMLVAAMALGVLITACEDDGGGGGSNRAPVIQQISTSGTAVSLGGQVQLACTAEDPEGDDLGYAWTCTSGQFLT